MPGKRKRTYRRKRRGRRRRRTKPTLGRSRLVPDIFFTKLMYPTGLSPTLSLNNVKHVFRGNSLFDPDETGVGSQPTGFDQFANFYQRYKVMASKITVKHRVIGSTASVGDALMIVVGPTIDAGEGVTNYADLVGRKYYRKQMVPDANSGYHATIKNYITTKKFSGVVNDEDFAAVVGNNPARQWYWNVLVSTVDNSVVSANVNVNLYIEVMYYCKFYEPSELDRS